MKILLLRSTLATASAIAIAIALCCSVATSAASDPHVVLKHVAWKSSNGKCTVDVQQASVTGLPPEVMTRVNAFLEKELLADASQYATPIAKRESDCNANALQAKADQDPNFEQSENADWTTGLAHGRWLSMRLHIESYTGGAHGNDLYLAKTFDLAHGGYPVPLRGFFLTSQRARLDAPLLKNEIAQIKSTNPDYGFDATSMKYLHDSLAEADIADHDILVTKNGIEVTGLGHSEADRNMIVAAPFIQLSGVGTPGGPLDATTR